MTLTESIKSAVLLILLGIGMIQLLFAREQSDNDPALMDKKVVIDEYQRSSRIYQLRWFEGSDSTHGEELYFIKCWLCHNEYTIKMENYPAQAPTLVGLYKRPLLMSGEPVNDQTVANKILNGGPAMPAYKHMLNEKDMADLLKYLREDCCWDEDHPPVNPWYRADD